MGGLDRVASRKLEERVAKLEKRVTMLTLSTLLLFFLCIFWFIPLYIF